MDTATTQEQASAAARSFVISGNRLLRTGCYGAAEKLYQRALILVQTTLGTLHPVAAEVLECYAELLAKTDRTAEAIAMKHRAEAVWEAYSPRFRRTYKEAQPYSLCCEEPEGSD
jgi:hypothetical protein